MVPGLRGRAHGRSGAADGIRHAQPVAGVQSGRQAARLVACDQRLGGVRDLHRRSVRRAQREERVSRGGLDRSRRYFCRSFASAVHAQRLQSGIEVVRARPRVRQGDADRAESQQGSVHERALGARRSQRVRHLHEGQRFRQARADRHRQRQGHGADAGREVGRRELRDLRRRSPARLCSERRRVLDRRRARSGHASGAAATAAAARRAAEPGVLAGQIETRVRPHDGYISRRCVDLGRDGRQPRALDDVRARRARSGEARGAAAGALQVVRWFIGTRSRLSSGRRRS